MAEWANDESKPMEIRAAMLKECAAYRCVKPKQTLAIESQVPVFQTEEQAEQFLAQFIHDMAPALEPAEITSMTKQWIEAKREGKELELKAIKDDPNVPVKVVIQGGLPPLPATNIVMPHNGHAIEGHRIAGRRPATNVAPETPPPQDPKDAS
jgi:hypothetical protein